MFPSYTWAGWKGLDAIYRFSGCDPDHLFDVVASIEEVGTGNWFSTDDYVASITQVWIINRFKCSVNLTGWVAHARFSNDKIHPSHGDAVTVDVFQKTLEAMITKAVIMLPAVAYDHSLGAELILERSWPIFLFITGYGY